ncbi:MAG: hypothetical protein JWO94_3121 [Verrucomicrobiaceae bacterium]|nr:hypothetical protein [Verrucomicrobiaceae bacterium]
MSSSDSLHSRALSWRRSLNDLANATSTMADRASHDQAPKLTVAIPFDHSGAWAAQTSFLRSVAVSMEGVRHPHGRILVLNLSGEEVAQTLAADLRDLMVEVDRDVWHNAEQRGALLASLGIDCVLNLFGPPPEVTNVGLVGWIADFQHFRLPQFFSVKEATARDEIFADTIARCGRVMLSSRDAERDCLRFEPAARGKTRVHSFPSGLVFQSLPKAGKVSVVDKYHLPEKFVLVANQFWGHKNHITIVEAARLLRERGIEIPIVMTGLPSDYRDPLNSLVSKVLQGIAAGGLRQTVIPLAQVPYADLVGLLRHAALIVQPSSFEGWSTTVQDGKALGRPVACSSIALHREQAPDAVGFFGPTSPGELADVLERVWPSLTVGPDTGLEVRALAEERLFAQNYGAALWRTCAEAASVVKAAAISD